VRRRLRFLVGVALGGGALAVGLQFAGTDAVVAHAARLAPWALVAVAALVVAPFVSLEEAVPLVF
jgi:hypothetical protein